MLYMQGLRQSALHVTAECNQRYIYSIIFQASVAAAIIREVKNPIPVKMNM